MLSNEIIPLPPEWIAAAGAAGADLTATGDKVVFSVPFKCEVAAAQLAMTATAGGSGVVKFDIRPTAGSDTSRGDGDLAVIKVLTTAAGKVLYKEPASRITLLPGQEVVVEATTGCTTTGTGRPMLLVKPVPERRTNLSAMVATT